MSTLATVTARCVHCMWRTDRTDPAEIAEVRDIHELVHPGGTVLVGEARQDVGGTAERRTGPPVPATNGAKVEPPARGNRHSSHWTRESVITALKSFAERTGRTPRQPELRKVNGLPSNSVLIRLFGSMTEALGAAGLEPPGRGGYERKRRGPAAAAAVPPPAAKPKKGQPSGQKRMSIEPEPAPAQASEGTREGTLVELARAVEEADTDWGEAIAVMEAAQERYEAARASLAEAVRVLAERLEAA